MEVIPAIDLKSGLCVRLYQGDYQQETVFSDDPLSVALAWQEQGAPRLHLVDLDGAAGGVPVNLDVITSIIQNLTIPVQVGGGIRDMATAESLFAAGAARVVIGTAAVEEPSLVEDLCRKHGSQRVIVAVDVKDGLVAIKGWLETTGVNAQDLVGRMALLGVRRQILRQTRIWSGQLIWQSWRPVGSRPWTTFDDWSTLGQKERSWGGLFTPKRSVCGKRLKLGVALTIRGTAGRASRISP